jgi:hypothetical protein
MFKNYTYDILLLFSELTWLDTHQLVEYVNLILEKSELSSDSVKSIIASARRLSSIKIENIFTYEHLSEINNMCLRLNTLKKKSTDAFRPFISSSTKTLCHSMRNPLKVAEDMIELEKRVIF